jgi:DNA-binding MarR family transcriptional regulator
MTAPAQAASPEVGADAPAVTEAEVTGRLHIALARLTRALRRGDQTELGPGSISALAMLRREGPIRPGDLAAREGVTPSTMTRIVALLESHGFLSKESDPVDRRACLVRTTGSGDEFLDQLTSARSRKLEERLNRLTNEQRTAIAAALPALEALAAEV